MSRTLTFARKLISLKNRVLVTDETGEQLYEATWAFGFPTRTWEISNSGGVVASFRRRLFSLPAKWDVDTPSGAYVLRKPWFSFVRRIRVMGGVFGNVEMVSGPFKMIYKISEGSKLLARADTKILTIRDRHDLVIEDDTPGVELLCVILVVNLMTQMFSASSAESGRSSTSDD